jgi:integrase
MANKGAKGKHPLWLHPSGQWTKKHEGRNYYFGTDRDAAEKRYRAEWDDITAGRPPRRSRDTVTVAELVNDLLNSKRRRVDEGRLTHRMWSEYHATCDAVVSAFGKTTFVADLRAEDFGKLRAKAAKRLGLYALAKFVQMVRTIFHYGFKTDLIAVPVKYGEEFDKPSQKELDWKQANDPAKLIEAADVWTLLAAADVQLRAMILLGLNAAYGQTDCSILKRSALTVRPGWLGAARRKTSVGRRCPLWPETIKALTAVAKVRPAPKDPADEDLVFVTYKGLPWVRFTDPGEGERGVRNDSVGQAFKALAKKAGVPGVGFCWLRHTFRTVADEVNDRVAIDIVMGHKDRSIAAKYREKVADERLQAVVNHVRDWLLNGRGA